MSDTFYDPRFGRERPTPAQVTPLEELPLSELQQLLLEVDAAGNRRSSTAERVRRELIRRASVVGSEAEATAIRQMLAGAGGGEVVDGVRREVEIRLRQRGVDEAAQGNPELSDADRRRQLAEAYANDPNNPDINQQLLAAIGANIGDDPSWVLDSFGRVPTEQEYAEIESRLQMLDPGLRFRNPAELKDYIARNPTSTMWAVSDVFTPGAMEITHRVPGTNVTLTNDTFQLLQREFGAQNVATIARIAERMNITDALTGEVDPVLVASVLRGNTRFRSMTEPEARRAVEEAQRRDSMQPRSTGGRRGSPSAAAADNREPPTGPRSTRAAEERMRRSDAGVMRQYADWDAQDIGAAQMAKIIEGRKLYKDSPLAWVHMYDPAAAARINAAGAGSVAEEDRMLLYRVAVRHNLETMEGLGYFLPGTLRSLLDTVDVRGGGGGGVTVRTPDPESIKQATTEMFTKLFQRQPTAEELAGMVGFVENQVRSKAETTQVDPQAQIRARMQQSAEWQEMFRNKPANMTEEEYVRQMESGVGQILGNEASTSGAVRAGMRTGSYQTAVGAAAASGQALDNSTFQGRLAAAFQTLGSL